MNTLLISGRLMVVVVLVEPLKFLSRALPQDFPFLKSTVSLTSLQFSETPEKSSVVLAYALHNPLRVVPNWSIK